MPTQAFRERRDLTNLAWFLILLCFSVSLLGIVQHFTSDAKIYGLRTLSQGGDPFGPFVNRNHFAGFVELTLPAGLALLIFRGLRRDMIPLTGLLTIVPIGAMILSGSRGGIVSFAFEVAVLALLARFRKAPEGPRLVALAIVGFAALALVAWLGVGTAIERFSTLHQGDVSLGRRGTMIRGAAHIFFDHPVEGAGLGSLVAVFPRYEVAYDGLVVDHVHNDYAELLAEMGILGGLCGLAFLWILIRDARKCFTAEQGHFSRAVHAGAIAALCGLLLHSLVDFNLHIPSNVVAVSAERAPSDHHAAAFFPGRSSAHTQTCSRAGIPSWTGNNTAPAAVPHKRAKGSSHFGRSAKHKKPKWQIILSPPGCYSRSCQNHQCSGTPFAQKYGRLREVEIPQSDSPPYAIARDAGELKRRVQRAEAFART